MNPQSLIYEAHGLNTFPREMGVTLNNYSKQSMHRFPVRSLPEFLKWSHGYKEKKVHAVFIEHNASVKTPTHKKILLATMFFDFDGKIDSNFTDKNTHKALRDLAKWYDYFDGYDRSLSFSGSGGHGILKLVPQMVDLERNDLGFHEVLQEFQMGIKKKLNLTTLDPKVTEPLKLMRVPNTPYVYMDRKTKQYVATDRYCIPINRDVLDWDIETIIHLSRTNSTQFFENMEGHRFDASTIIADAKVRSMEKRATEIMPVAGEINWSGLPYQLFRHTLEEIFHYQKSPHILQRLFLEDNNHRGHHPTHDTNLVAAIILRTAGLSANATKQIFSRISASAGWDNRDVSKQNFYIDQIYTAQYAAPQT